MSPFSKEETTWRGVMAPRPAIRRLRRRAKTRREALESSPRISPEITPSNPRISLCLILRQGCIRLSGHGVPERACHLLAMQTIMRDADDHECTNREVQAVKYKL